MNVVTIPKSHTVSEHGKVYTVYEISVTIQGRTHYIQKRYSELFYIYKILKKQGVTPPFPPKQMRNQAAKVIENRRIGLQQYLQWILNHDPLCNTLLDLLNIPHLYSNVVQSMDSLDTGAAEISHCSVISYEAGNNFISPVDDPQDCIVSSVLTALYNRT
ncbi:sorting nexin-24-like [Clavelina lepadiformis]|uniref:sorting nexin-24-like n=1 Tax=Clavelina lepadiformis TaxID=159417 RepID=UPI0040424F77